MGNRQPPRFDVVLRDENIDDGRIRWHKIIAVRLNTIQSMKAVEDLMDRVRTA